MKKRIVIVGAGGLGREILSMLKSMSEWEPIGFLDDNLRKYSSISDLPVLGAIDDAKSSLKPNTFVVIAIGDPKTKSAIAARLDTAALRYPVLIHPQAVIMDKKTIIIGNGTVIGAGAILTTDILIEKHVLININATLGHDVRLGNHSSLMPGVNIAGGVLVGESVLIGAGANILNGLKLGNDCIVGAGAVVTDHVIEGETVMGVPARSKAKEINRPRRKGHDRKQP